MTSVSLGGEPPFAVPFMNGSKAQKAGFEELRALPLVVTRAKYLLVRCCLKLGSLCPGILRKRWQGDQNLRTDTARAAYVVIDLATLCPQTFRSYLSRA